MAYTPENNPYAWGDPYMYDLKWIVSRLNTLLSTEEYARIAEDAANRAEEAAQGIAPLPFITPEMFGAVGDGTHDDTQAFEDMLNSITFSTYPVNSVENARKASAIVVLDSKTYAVSHTISIPANVCIIGAGVSNSIIKCLNSMNIVFNFIGANYGEGFSVCKKNILCGFAIDGGNLANYGITNSDNGVWLQECIFEDLYITGCNYSGLDIVSCWLSRFVNIKCENSAIPFIFTTNINNNGFNNNLIENITASNFTIIGMLLEVTNCKFNTINIERAADYNRGQSSVTALIHNNITFDASKASGIYIYGNCDTNTFDGIWFEWIANSSNTPCITVENIATYSNGQFKALTAIIKNVHIGTAFKIIYLIKSGIIELDGLRAEITTQTAIDTTGAQTNTSLTVKNISNYYATSLSTITLPYGAYKLEVYDANGSKTVKQGSYYNKYADDSGKLHYERTDSDGGLSTYNDGFKSRTVYKDAPSYEPYRCYVLSAGSADANGYFDLGFETPSGHSISGVFVARNQTAQTDVNQSHWVQFTTLSNDHAGVRMANGNSPITYTSGAVYGLIVFIT